MSPMRMLSLQYDKFIALVIKILVEEELPEIRLAQVQNESTFRGLLEGPPPDLILLDLPHHSPSGLALLIELRRDSRLAAVPTIVCHGWGSALSDRAIGLGCVAAIDFPFDVDDFVGVVRRCLPSTKEELARLAA